MFMKWIAILDWHDHKQEGKMITVCWDVMLYNLVGG